MRDHTDSLAGKDIGEALLAKAVAGVFAPLVNDAATKWESPLEQCCGFTWQLVRLNRLTLKEKK